MSDVDSGLILIVTDVSFLEDGIISLSLGPDQENEMGRSPSVAKHTGSITEFGKATMSLSETESLGRTAK